MERSIEVVQIAYVSESGNVVHFQVSFLDRDVERFVHTMIVLLDRAARTRVVQMIVFI